jgi:secondary thiamine-phosphate synthase enzyme
MADSPFEVSPFRNTSFCKRKSDIEFEPGLRKDLPSTLDRLMPPSRDYGHEQTWHDGNGHSHLHATILGQGVTVPISEGKLIFGTWQQIFLAVLK